MHELVLSFKPIMAEVSILNKGVTGVSILNEGVTRVSTPNGTAGVTGVSTPNGESYGSFRS